MTWRAFDQHHLERGVLEQVVERLPVVAGRLHHDQRDPSVIKCSRNASTWLVTAPQVVTVDLAAARPAPATRTQTFASRLETSTPAHRGCMRSMATSPFRPVRQRCAAVRSGEGRKTQKSDARARRQQSTVPVGALHHQADLQARGTTEAPVSDRNEHDPPSSSAPGSPPDTRAGRRPTPNLREPRRALERALGC